MKASTHWICGTIFDDSSVTRLDELLALLPTSLSSSVDLLDQGVELTSNVSSVDSPRLRVTGGDLTWVVQDDNLSSERSSSLWWVVLGVTTDVTSSGFP